MTTLNEALCRAAGWTYCAEHDRPLWRGYEACIRRHPKVERHHYWCPAWDDRDCCCTPYFEYETTTMTAPPNMTPSPRHSCETHLGILPKGFNEGSRWVCPECGLKWQLAVLPPPPGGRPDPGRFYEGVGITGPDGARYWRTGFPQPARHLRNRFRR